MEKKGRSAKVVSVRLSEAQFREVEGLRKRNEFPTVTRALEELLGLGLGAHQQQTMERHRASAGADGFRAMVLGDVTSAVRSIESLAIDDPAAARVLALDVLEAVLRTARAVSDRADQMLTVRQ